MINQEQQTHFQTMLETLIYIVHEINLEQVKLTTTINQLVQRMNQNEFYLNQLNHNVETFYEQFYVSLEERQTICLIDHCRINNILKWNQQWLKNKMLNRSI